MDFIQDAVDNINRKLQGGIAGANHLLDANVMATITGIHGMVSGSDNIDIFFTRNDGSIGAINFQHQQDCCESVAVDQVDGNVERHIGAKLYGIREKTSHDKEEAPDSENWDDSNTWTFYDLETSKGRLSFRWHGSSNGYYSEDVDIVQKDSNGYYSEDVNITQQEITR